MDVLELTNITKSYGKVKALNGISLAVPEGAIFGILGPNGSGKTTLLSIILDVLSADNGQYKWFGQKGSKEQRKQIGSLLETPNFYHYLSAVSNLKITQSISGRGMVADIENALKTVDLFDRRNSRFSSFSLGMKQRLAIAAALLGDPRVLVLDEPTNGLDPVGIAEIRDLIKNLHKRGHTIIMASHLLDEVEKICTHVTILKTGNIIATGEVDEVLSDEDTIELGSADNPALFRLLQDYPGLLHCKTEGKLLLLGFEKGKADAAAINNFCFKNGYVLQHLAIKKKRLETRFFELTNN
ncbi:ABC transporter ATP-binding protein [Flavihumibacter profundi]|jgi:ABC-2 type transport system ATP-binding protein|uniref:ABC transporter ATP-binding protein n=1 Tax=Flavihumibacter profundi TaxID=2716883 RepID=UPI001CC73639|nr:ABC transporter ATP-binding protein [Flavihumibacter profundi]MBZ5858242.1 ABC transporter ATP-binding protein [Flavihumibacter profundi]